MHRRALVASCAATILACGPRHEHGARTERTRGDDEAGEIAAGTRASAADGVATGISTSELRFVRNIIGFQGPESVKYDPDQDVFFVTNMVGAGSVKDGNGYISRVSAAHPESATVFVEGGKRGAVLDAPKGTALHGDTLWVADISVLRAFDRHTGAPLANIDFAPLGAVQLNDVAVGPDGTIRVTDTGIMMSPKGVIHLGPDRVFEVGAGARVRVVAGAPGVTWPNGIAWDGVGRRWVVVSFDPADGRVNALAPDGASTTVLRHGSGRADGVEVLPNGSIVFTTWSDSSVHVVEHGIDRRLLREVPEAADIGIDTRRHRLAVPLSTLNRVQLWSMGSLGRSAR